MLAPSQSRFSLTRVWSCQPAIRTWDSTYNSPGKGLRFVIIFSFSHRCFEPRGRGESGQKIVGAGKKNPFWIMSSCLQRITSSEQSKPSGGDYAKCGPSNTPETLPPLLSDWRIKKRGGMKACIDSWSMSIIILLASSGWILWLYWWCDHCCYVVGGGMPLYYLITLCLFFHKDTQLCKPWRDFLRQMIEMEVGKDLWGHFTLTLASDCVASNKRPPLPLGD